jgi:hypothetical protein
LQSSTVKFLTSPRPPSNSIGFVTDSLAVVDLRRARGRFVLAASAITQLPSGLVTPGFDEKNINDHSDLVDIIRQTAEAAGLANKRRWSVALPEGVARTLVLTLESKPANRRELDEIISWKLERAIAVPVSALRVSRQRLKPLGGPGGRAERYLVTAARDDVLADYESLFGGLGWRTGLMLPAHLGEAQWLGWDSAPGDKMLVSVNMAGFSSLIMKAGEPALFRLHECEPASIPDELYRVALYYMDRIADPGSTLGRILMLGDMNKVEALQAIGDALSTEPALIDPISFGFKMSGESIPFDSIAAAAGLATLPWQ